MGEKRMKYDSLFKENAVLLSYEKELMKDAAEELKVSPKLLCRWRKEYQEYGKGSFQGSGYPRVHPDRRLLFDLERKAAETTLRFEILKKASSCLSEGKPAIYEFIRSNEKNYSITTMCHILNIGITGYIRWKKKGLSEKKRNIIALKKDIAALFLKSKKQYGRGRIATQLQLLGYKIGPRRVGFYMKQLGLHRKRKRKFIATTDSIHYYFTAPNILDRNFRTEAPGKAWVSDITYLQTSRGFVYLTIILDLFDRKIIGWHLSSALTVKKTVLPAFDMAVSNRKIYEGLIFHSDRGSQYASRCFTSKLEQYKCIRSMSRKGNCFDNAVAESFFSIFKRELILGADLQQPKKLKDEVFEYIENWYNKKRIHTALGFKTIEQFNDN
ncbi:MAG: IS3 family transposase [Flavobacterium nitrogenifigens]|uniref:IS3 family transposase n=1 Tax=Flavobacterium nitrogenifigens TaxID=1617283 RepID=UPI002806BBEE|nr:IS3 family transposase [Flavobacterium nitrogenifigens]MDQ8014301.1 IS3 family transposase [Flavobacterium nitrogenifigens]